VSGVKRGREKKFREITFNALLLFQIRSKALLIQAKRLNIPRLLLTRPLAANAKGRMKLSPIKSLWEKL
jgi:hypothetical protein